jgi:L-lactate dehydrogenase complex protein LldF
MESGAQRVVSADCGSLFNIRGRALSPTEQGAWTSCRTPLTPAPKRLRALLKETKA